MQLAQTVSPSCTDRKVLMLSLGSCRKHRVQRKSSRCEGWISPSWFAVVSGMVGACGQSHVPMLCLKRRAQCAMSCGRQPQATATFRLKVGLSPRGSPVNEPGPNLRQIPSHMKQNRYAPWTRPVSLFDRTLQTCSPLA